MWFELLLVLVVILLPRRPVRPTQIHRPFTGLTLRIRIGAAVATAADVSDAGSKSAVIVVNARRHPSQFPQWKTR